MSKSEILKILMVIQTAGYLGLFIVSPGRNKQIRKLNRIAYNGTLKDFKRQVKELKAMK